MMKGGERGIRFSYVGFEAGVDHIGRVVCKIVAGLERGGDSSH